jgi:hypothetical protein
VIKATAIDYKPEIEELRRALQTRVTKTELGSMFKAQTAVIEEIRKDQTDMRSQGNMNTDDMKDEKAKNEQMRSDIHKKLTQIFRDIEKMQV